MRSALKSLPILLLLAACSSTIDRGAMRSEMQRESRFTTDASVEEIERLQPQIRVPFRLAVAPPSSPDRWTHTHWSSEEVAEIRSWEPELRRDGIVSEIVLIPNVTVGETGRTAESHLQALRQAAARQHADAVLVTRTFSDHSTWANPLGVLDLTIVGMWIVPGHEAEAVTMMEGAVVDVRNEYLYGSGRVEGSASATRPLKYVKDTDVEYEARLRALDALGDKLVEETRAAVVRAAASSR